VASRSRGDSNGRKEIIARLAARQSAGRSRCADGNLGINTTITSDGSLDTSFDTDGKASIAVGGSGGTPSAEAVVVQADGKVIVAGKAWDDSGSDNQYRFHLARFTASGAADTSFSSDGIVLTVFMSGAYEHAFDLGLMGDGRIVAVGHTGTSGSNNFLMARYKADGSLDSSFGGGTASNQRQQLRRGPLRHAAAVRSAGRQLQRHEPHGRRRDRAGAVPVRPVRGGDVQDGLLGQLTVVARSVLTHSEP
jgi:uncharacterized delta-60 repeat protein